MYSKLIVSYLFLITLCLSRTNAAATNSTKCDAACSQNPLCSTGTCLMTKCTDNGTGCLNVNSFRKN